MPYLSTLMGWVFCARRRGRGVGRGGGKGGAQVADRRRAGGGFEIGNVPFVGRDDAMMRQRKETTTARARGRGAVGGSRGGHEPRA